MTSCADSYQQHQEFSLLPYAVNQTGIFLGSFPDDTNDLDMYLLSAIQDQCTADSFLSQEGDQSSDGTSSCGSDRDFYGNGDYSSDIDMPFNDMVKVVNRGKKLRVQLCNFINNPLNIVQLYL